MNTVNETHNPRDEPDGQPPVDQPAEEQLLELLEANDASAEVYDLACRVAEELGRLRQVERDIRDGQEYAIGWLAGCMRAFDVLPGNAQLDRWMGEVKQVLAEVSKAEAIVRRATGNDLPQGGERQ